MGLFDMCCPKKPKKSLDYIIKWVENADKRFKDIDTYLENLNTAINGDNGLDNRVTDLEDWKSTIDSNISDLVAEAVEDYDWSTLPEEALSHKVDKVPSASYGSLAFFDGTGNITSSHYSTKQLVGISVSGGEVSSRNLTVNLPSPDANVYGAISVAEHNNESVNIVLTTGLKGAATPVLETTITHDNMPNLQRALENPDVTPKTGSNKLITSGAVKDAILGVNNVDPRTSAGNTSITINTTDNSVSGLSDFEMRFPNQRFPYFIKLGLYNGSSTSYIDNAVLKYYKDGMAYKVSIYTAANVIDITGTVTIEDDEEIITWGNAVFTNQADVDTIPTYGSSKLINSEGVYSALQSKADSVHTHRISNINNLIDTIISLSDRVRELEDSPEHQEITCSVSYPGYIQYFYNGASIIYNPTDGRNTIYNLPSSLYDLAQVGSKVIVRSDDTEILVTYIIEKVSGPGRLKLNDAIPNSTSVMGTSIEIKIIE